VSTAQDLPVPYGEPVPATATAFALRLVPVAPLDFDESVRRVRPRLHRYAARRLGDLHEAEELVQEALLRAYAHREQLLTEDDLAAWATVVTGRLVIDRLRVRGRSTSVAEVPDTYRVSRDTADVVVARDEARTALDALDAMHPRQAALLWAREVEGQSYEDLCARFGMTEPAVRSVLTRARKALRKEYSARGGTLPVGGLAVLAPWITGLGWVERVRRAAGRITAPAALSAVGFTALGGLVLSPFSYLPGHAPSTFRPSTAVVFAPDGSGYPAPHTTAPRVATPATSRIITTQRPPTTTTGANGSLPSVGCSRPLTDSTCSRAESMKSNVVWVNVPLPDNPTGITYVRVTSNKIDCAAVPTNPVVKCAPKDDPTPQGALK
jgi:RNA polymerase sigma-70 factor (ECF subfamily)